jgi:hypothetical protein
LDICADPWRAGGTARRFRSQLLLELDRWRRCADLEGAMFDVEIEMIERWYQHTPICRAEP